MRLATFNLLHGASWPDGVVDVDRAVAAVASLDADILALQEVDRNQPRSHHADLTALIAAATGAVSSVFLPVLIGDMTAPHRVAAAGGEDPEAPAYGIALLSRYPATEWRSLRLPQLPVRYPQRQQRRVIRTAEEPRAALLGEFATPAGPVAVANVHLSFVLGSRTRQLRRLVRRLAPVPDPVLLVGDLNLPGHRPARITGFRPLSSRLTFPADRPTKQIDHVLLRGRLGRLSSTAAPALPISDHRPLVVDLALE